jgi:YfiH family protein
MLLKSPRLSGAAFSHAFPTRDTADTELLQELRSVRVVQVKQVHGAHVAVAGGETDGTSPASPGRGQHPTEADAIVGRAKQSDVEGVLAVGVRVADCVPVLVGDEETGDVAAIHAGWRGVEAGVIGAAMAALRARSPVAAIGPCIEACCFEVGADVAARLGFVVREEGGKAFVDLRAAVREQLRRCGVPDDRIDDVPGCTKHEPRFHSFRRDGANSGRMLAAIATRPLSR